MASSHRLGNLDKSKRDKNVNSVSTSSFGSQPNNDDDDDDIDYIPVGILQISSGRQPPPENTISESTASLQRVCGNLSSQQMPNFQHTIPNIPQLEHVELDRLDHASVNTRGSVVPQNLLSAKAKGYSQPQLIEHSDLSHGGDNAQALNRNMDNPWHRKEAILQLLQAQQQQKEAKLAEGKASSHSITPHLPGEALPSTANYTQASSQPSYKQGNLNRNAPMPATGSQHLLKILSQPHRDNVSSGLAQLEPKRTSLETTELPYKTSQNSIRDFQSSQQTQPLSAPNYKGSNNNKNNHLKNTSFAHHPLAVNQNSQLMSHSNLSLHDLQDGTESQPNWALRIDTSEKSLPHSNIPKIAEQLLQQSPTQTNSTTILSVQAHPHNLNQQHPEISKRLNSPVSPSRQGGSPWQPPSPRQPGSPRQAVSPRLSSGSPRQPSVSPCQFVSPRQSVSPRQFLGSNHRPQTVSPQSFHAPSPRLPPSSPSLPLSSSPARRTTSPAQFNPGVSGAAFSQFSAPSAVQSGIVGQGLIGVDKNIPHPAIQPLATHPSPGTNPSGIVHHRPLPDSTKKFMSQATILQDNASVSHAFEPASKSAMLPANSQKSHHRQLASSSHSVKSDHAKTDETPPLQPPVGLFSSQPLPLSSFSSLEPRRAPNHVQVHDVKGFDMNSNNQSFSVVVSASQSSSSSAGSQGSNVSALLEEAPSAKGEDRSLQSFSRDATGGHNTTSKIHVPSTVPLANTFESVSNSSVVQPQGMTDSSVVLEPRTKLTSEECSVSHAPLEGVVKSKGSLSVLSEVASEQYVLAVQEQTQGNSKKQSTDDHILVHSKSNQLETKSRPSTIEKDLGSDSCALSSQGLPPLNNDSEESKDRGNASNMKVSIDSKKAKDVSANSGTLVSSKNEEPVKRLRKPKVPFENDDSPSPRKRNNEKRSSSVQGRSKNVPASSKGSTQPQSKVQADISLKSTVTTRSGLRVSAPHRKSKTSVENSRNASKLPQRNSDKKLLTSVSNSKKDNRGRQLRRLSRMRHNTRQLSTNKSGVKTKLRKKRDVSPISSKEELESRMSTRNSVTKQQQLESKKDPEISDEKTRSKTSSHVEKVVTRTSENPLRSTHLRTYSVPTRMTTRQSDGTGNKGKRAHLEFLESLPLHTRKRAKTIEMAQGNTTTSPATEDSSNLVRTRSSRSKLEVKKKNVDRDQKAEKTSTEDSDPMEQDEDRDDDADEDFEAEDDDADDDEDDDDDDEDYDSSPAKIRRVRPSRVLQVRRSARMRQKTKKVSDEEQEDLEADETGSDRSRSGRESRASRSKLRVLRKRSRAPENKTSQDLKTRSATKNEDYIKKDKSIAPSPSTDVPPLSKTEDVKEEDLPQKTLDWSKVDRSKMVAYKLVPVPVEEATVFPDSMVPVVGYVLQGTGSDLIILPSDTVKPYLGRSPIDTVGSDKGHPSLGSRSHGSSSSVISSKSSSRLSAPLSAPVSSRVLVTPKPISSIGVSNSNTFLQRTLKGTTRSPTSTSSRTQEPSPSAMAHWNQSRDLPPPQHPPSSHHSQIGPAASSSSSVRQTLQSPCSSQTSHVPSSFPLSAPLSASPTMTTPPPSASSSSSLSSMSWNSAPTMPWLVQEMEPPGLGSWTGSQVAANHDELWTPSYPGRSSYGGNSAGIAQGQTNVVGSTRLDMQLLDDMNSSGQALRPDNAQGFESTFMEAGPQSPFLSDEGNLNPDPLFSNSPQQEKMRQDRSLPGCVQQVTPSPSPSYNIALPGLGQQDISFLESKMHQDMDISSTMLLSEVPYEDGIQGHVALDQDPANLVCSVNLDDADTLALRENSTALNLPVGVEQLRDNTLLPLSKMDTAGSQDETVDQTEDVVDESNDKSKPPSTHVRRQLYEILSEGGKRFCKCLICGKNYSMTSIYRHLRKHNNPDFAFSCELCGKRYSQKHHLLVHVKKMHGGATTTLKGKGQGSERDKKEELEKNSKAASQEPSPPKEGKKKSQRQRSGERKQSKETLFYEEMPDSPTPLDEGCKRELQQQVEAFRKLKAEKKYAARGKLTGIVTNIFSKHESTEEGVEKGQEKSKTANDSYSGNVPVKPSTHSSESVPGEKSESEKVKETRTEYSKKSTKENQKRGTEGFDEKNKSNTPIGDNDSSLSKSEDLVDKTINAVAHSVYPDVEEGKLEKSPKPSDLKETVTDENRTTLSKEDVSTNLEVSHALGSSAFPDGTSKQQGMPEPKINVDDSGSQKSKFPCNLCKSVLSSKCSYLMHIRRHNSQKTQVCSYCGKGFVTGQELRSHVRTHTGERPFECPICKYKFAHSGSYQAHKKGHIKRGETEPFPEDKCHSGPPPRRRRTISAEGKNRRKLESQNKSESGSSDVSPSRTPYRPEAQPPLFAGRLVPEDRRFSADQTNLRDNDIQSGMMRRGSLDSNFSNMNQGKDFGDNQTVETSRVEARRVEAPLKKGVAPSSPYPSHNFPSPAPRSYHSATSYGMLSGGHMLSQTPRTSENYPPSNFPPTTFSPNQSSQYGGQPTHPQHSTQLPPHQMSPYDEYQRDFYHHPPSNTGTFSNSTAVHSHDRMARVPPPSTVPSDIGQEKLPRAFDQSQYVYVGDSTPMNSQQTYPQSTYSATMLAKDSLVYNSTSKTNSPNEIVNSLLEHYHVPPAPFPDNVQGPEAVASGYSARASQNTAANPSMPLPSQPPPPPYNPEIPPPPYTASIQYKEYYNNSNLAQQAVSNPGLPHGKPVPHPEGLHIQPVYNEAYKESPQYPHQPCTPVSVIRSNASHSSDNASPHLFTTMSAAHNQPQPQYLPDTRQIPTPVAQEKVHSDFESL